MNRDAFGKPGKKEVKSQNSPTGGKEVYLPCTKRRVCHHEAGSLVSNYQSAQTTYVAVSQGLAFLRELAKFFACLEPATGEWRM